MAASDNYIVEKPQDLEIQEGNDCLVVLNFPTSFDISGATVRFYIWKNTTTTLIEKTTDNDITINGSKIEVLFSETDTKGKSGKYYYEIDVNDAATYGKVTVMYGNIEIINTRNND